MLHSQQSQKSVKNVRWLLNFSRTNQGLNMFGKINGQMPNTRPSTAKGLEKNQVGCHLSPATPKDAGEGGTKIKASETPKFTLRPTTE